MSERAPRPAARIVLTDPEDRVLLFRFTPPDREPFWATPGGACDPGEDFAATAARELREETGLRLDCGSEIARRQVEFTDLEGRPVAADERYFRVRAPGTDILTEGHTALERRVMTSYRWFAPHELADWPETIFPEDLADILKETA